MFFDFFLSHVYIVIVYFFFFKQKTAYEMRISDWSSDVCSSDLATPPDMPAAKLRPVEPSTTTVPPVMYSQPWSPVPSTTAMAPELRTAKRSPATPLK